MAPRKSGKGDTLVCHHKIVKIDFYEISEEELNQLEHGTQSDKYLEFGIASSSAFIAFFIAWKSTDIETQAELRSNFFTVMIVTAVIAIIFLILWYVGRKNRKDLIAKIRARKSPDDEQ